jgi:hypothetical protein
MRPLVVVFMLVTVKAFAYVEIPKPKILARTADRVLEACEGQSDKGCTKFTGVECIRVEDGWKLDASARAVPEMHVTATSWIKHEMSHIHDFKRMLVAHTTALGAPRFATQAECTRLLTAASDAFPETMQRIARISGDRRDGTRRSTSEDHLVVMKAEVMPKLVDDRLAHLGNDVPAVSRDAKYRTAENRNLVGQSGKHVKASLRQSDAPVDTKQFVVVRSVTKDVAVFLSRLFFDDDDHVVEQPRKLLGQLFESLFDELLELRSA